MVRTRRVTRASATTGDAELADALLDVDGVAGVWTFATDSRFDRHGWRTGDKTITVCYLDADPCCGALSATWCDAVVRDAPSGLVLLRGPFETITPWRWDWFDEEALSPDRSRPESRHSLTITLPRVAPGEQQVERLGGVLEAVDDVLGVLDLPSASHPTMSIWASGNRSR